MIRSLITPAAPDDAAKHVNDSSRFTRSKVVSISSDWLPRPGEAIQATLFNGESIDITVDETTVEAGGLFTSGHISGHPELPAFYGSYGETVAASILTLSGKSISIFPKQGIHILAERSRRGGQR